MIYEVTLTNPDSRVHLIADSLEDADDKLLPILESLAVDGNLPNIVSIQEAEVPANIGEPEHQAPVIGEQDQRGILHVNVGVGDENFEPTPEDLSSLSEAFNAPNTESVAE